MDNLGHILWEYKTEFVGGDVCSRPGAYRWEGPPVATIGMDHVHRTLRQRSALRAGDKLQIGPFHCQVVECHWEGWYTVRRLDDHRVQSWLLGRWFVVKQYGRMVRRRLILTLAIWDLADWPQADEPGWTHIWQHFKK